jgi:hypothetical protein
MLKRGNDHLSTTPVSSRVKNGRIETVNATLEELQQTIASLAEKYPSEKLVADLQCGFDKLGEVIQAMTSVETAEEKERKRSLVVIGLPESDSEDSIARADADSQSVVNMLRALNIETRPDKHYRMGRRNDNNSTNNFRKGPRLLKVVMPSSALQRQTLGALRFKRQQLKAVVGFDKAIVRPSLSPEELAEDRKLRELLKQKRTDNPGVKIFIRKGQIVIDGQESQINSF